MKRFISVQLVFVFLFLLCTPNSASAVSNMPKRVINLVYDDSGSMINNNDNKNVDTWCQAKYAMEVFAAMLNNNDTMNIYTMSDFSNGSSSGARINLTGKNSVKENVSKIHSMLTAAKDTPFAAVKKAYSDLNSCSADEKWLVVLTDGEFQGVENVDDYFSKKSKDINIMFLGMGSDAQGIKSDESNNIFYEKAKTNNEILSKITDICTRIFNSDKLKVDVSSKKFSFDIPMNELIVFVQGAKASIDGIENSKGTLIKPTEDPVSVKYSEKPATNYSNFIVNKNLKGSIATFSGDFDPGEYSVKANNAETIEIYYKPNIEISAYLINSNNEEIEDLSNIEAGEYTIEFGFVKSGTKTKLSNSKLLGEVKYEASIKNNSKDLKGTYSSGDKLTVEEGSLEICVDATYLKYHEVSTNLNYTVYTNKNIEFTQIDYPTCVIDRNGVTESKPISVKALINGKEFSESQWESMGIPKVESLSSTAFSIEKVEKSDEKGVFLLYPSVNGNLGGETYENLRFSLKYSEKQGDESWSGSSEVELNIKDTRSWLEKNRDLVIKLIILLILLIIILGYMPFIKNYLPKSLKKKPYIRCVPTELGAERKDRNGSVEKNLLSTIIPYAPQKGTIKFVPKGVTGVPTMQVRAIKRRRMSVTNIKSYIGKNITFDGSTIKKDCKKFEISAGVILKVEKNGWKYMCTPSQSKK